MLNIWYPKNRLDKKYVCTPEELYEGVKFQGYDWEQLLLITRGYTSFDPDHPLLELSTLDLLRMRVGEYHPYWMEKDKKTIKKEYRKNIAHLDVSAPTNAIVREAKAIKADAEATELTDEAKLEAELKKSLVTESA